MSMVYLFLATERAIGQDVLTSRSWGFCLESSSSLFGWKYLFKGASRAGTIVVLGSVRSAERHSHHVLGLYNNPVFCL